MSFINPQTYDKIYPGYFLTKKLENYSLDDFSLTDNGNFKDIIKR